MEVVPSERGLLLTLRTKNDPADPGTITMLHYEESLSDILRQDTLTA